MAAKFKTAKQLYAQDKDSVLFPNIAQAHTGVACDHDLQTLNVL